uniref:non-specific serine/threonine protein kinase n=1 Tax=Chenopodium quinoa TaxID=63459 RepID=A0A803MTA9_CHEQI
MALSSRNDNEIEEILNNPDDLERDPTGQFIRFNNVIGIETSKKVYEGLDTYNDVKIAWSKIEVGQIGEAGLKKCCQEAELWKSLNHQNISVTLTGMVKLADFGVAVYKEPSNFTILLLVHQSTGHLRFLAMVSCENIYSEYKNLADIDDAVKSGVMPVALEQVYDPQLKRFIERCLVPSSQRPVASELLKDPFLTDRKSGHTISVFVFFVGFDDICFT